MAFPHLAIRYAILDLTSIITNSVRDTSVVAYLNRGRLMSHWLTNVRMQKEDG